VCVCVCVCLSVWLAGCLAGWLAGRQRRCGRSNWNLGQCYSMQNERESREQRAESRERRETTEDRGQTTDDRRPSQSAKVPHQTLSGIHAGARVMLSMSGKNMFISVWCKYLQRAHKRSS
jgi:hypothetical protein